MLEKNWASIDDFATLFQYFWYRDFPMSQKAKGVHRTDWTIHIGAIVLNIANFMGFVTRFEAGGRKDAVLRSADGDEVAIEWEWGGVWGNELEKLKKHVKLWPKNKEGLKYAVLITYTHTPNIEKVYTHVKENWKGARWPLLLILIDVIDVTKSTITMGKEFKNIQMSIFNKGEKVERIDLKLTPALPWEVQGTRWSYEIK
jgi:hypothetical protein